MNRTSKVLGGSVKPKKKKQTKGKGVMKILTKKKSQNNLEIPKFTEKLKFPNFIGVFMRNTLPKTPSDNESAAVNLDVTTGPGTDWVCYYK